jgi:multidrug efflux pump subunit AcrA (membrane-fusion protein)
MRLSFKHLLPLIILAVAVVGFLYLRATRPQQAAIETKERVWQVEVVEVQPSSLAPALTLYGRVETPEMMKAAAPRSGRVTQVLVREGARVTPGQLLLALDPRDFDPPLKKARADVAELKAQIDNEILRHQSDRQALKHETALLALSERAVKRAQRLKTQKLSSDADVDQALQEVQRQSLSVTNRQLALDEHNARLRQLEARLERAEAGLAEAELARERSRVEAPFSGLVASVDVSKGDQVQANQLLLTLYPTEQLEVRARIPAPYQAELQRALARNQRLTARGDTRGSTIELALDRFAGEADPTGTDALFRIERGLDSLRPGSMITLRLSRAPRNDAIALPYQALYGSRRIYKLVDGRMLGIEVTPVGEYLDDTGQALLLVTSPELEAGDRVVTTHLPNAISGLLVQAVNTNGARAAQAGSTEPKEKNLTQ